jgi:hypothetical protein
MNLETANQLAPLQSIAMFSAVNSTGVRATADLNTSRVIQITPDTRDKGFYIPRGLVRWVREMGGTPTAANVIAQYLYWFDTDEKGKPRASRRIKGDPSVWVVKEHEELAAEAGLTEKMVKDSVKWACDRGILKKETHGFGGKRATYVRFACADGKETTTPEAVMRYAYPLTISTHRSVCETALGKITIKTCGSVSAPPYGPIGTLHKYPQVLSNTENTETENTKVKIFKQHPSALPLSAEESTGKNEQDLQGESTPKPKKEKKLKYGKGFDHYVELEKNGNDMESLLKTCIAAGFVDSGRIMLADAECSYLLRIEHALKGSVFDDTLEGLVLALGDWDGFCWIVEGVAGKELHPPITRLNKLAFVVKHMGKFFDEAKATEQATPPTEPAASKPAEVAAPASAPEPEQADTDPLIEQDEGEDEELLLKMGKDFFRPIALDDLKKYLEVANAEAIKKAAENAKKPKPHIHA